MIGWQVALNEMTHLSSALIWMIEWRVLSSTASRFLHLDSEANLCLFNTP